MLSPSEVMVMLDRHLKSDSLMIERDIIQSKS